MLSLMFTPQGVWLAGLSLMLLATKKKKEDFEIVYVLFLLTSLGAISLFFYQHHVEQGLLIKTPLLITEFIGYIVTLVSSFFLVRERLSDKQEALMLLIIATIAYSFLLQSESLLSVFISIELLAFSLYTLVALSPFELSYEAALKYFIQGSFASMMILLALCLLYGLYGEQVLLFAPQAMNVQLLSSGAIVVALLAKTLLLCALCFKLGLVPFHFWVTDVYSRSSLSSLMYLGIIPKIAFFTLLYKMLHFWFPFAQSPFPQSVFIFLSLLTLYWANMSALASKTLGKILAYSSMGQMAFLLFVYLISTVYQTSYLLGLYHLLAYSLSFIIVLGTFFLGGKALNADQSSLCGEFSRSPCLTLIAIGALLSLAGLPPFPGFFSKLFIFSSLLTVDHVEIVIAALPATVIACAVYLKLIASLITPQQEVESEKVSRPFSLKALIKILFFALLFLTYQADFFVLGR